MNARALPAAPALPEHSTDATGVLTGNADLAGSSQWQPPQGEPERPPLPGCEHQANLPKAFPWLTERRMFCISWIAGAVGIVLGAARYLP